METPGNLFAVAAPSGAGKSSLVKALLELDSHLAVSVSHTTRAPRGQEQHGREYWFVDEPEFRAMADRGEFFEWAQVHGKLYGTSRLAIADRFGADKATGLRPTTCGAGPCQRRPGDARSRRPAPLRASASPRGV